MRFAALPKPPLQPKLQPATSSVGEVAACPYDSTWSLDADQGAGSQPVTALDDATVLVEQDRARSVVPVELDADDESA